MGRRPAQRPVSTKFLLFWLPILLYVGLIFILSAQSDLKPPIKFPQSDKLMHLLEYGVLGLLLARAIHAVWPRLTPAALLSLCIGIAIGTGDELFQSTVAGREPSALDLLADTLGVGLAQLVHRAIKRG